MEIIYKLTDKEKEFLLVLKSKEDFPNAITGRSCDDKIREEYEDEWYELKKAGLLEWVDTGEGSYWRYELSEKGLQLQNDLSQ